MSAVCFSAVSEHSIKRAQELVSDRLQEIAHHRATAGLQEHHDGHSRHQLQAAKPPSLATGQRQPDFIVSCIATGLPIAAQIGRDIRHDHSCGFAKSGRHVGGPRRQANRSPPRTDAERHCIRGRCPGNGQRGSAGCRRCMREMLHRFIRSQCARHGCRRVGACYRMAQQRLVHLLLASPTAQATIRSCKLNALAARAVWWLDLSNPSDWNHRINQRR